MTAMDVALDCQWARAIVELHRGRIWAESAGINQGTVIWLLLPKYQESMI